MLPVHNHSEYSALDGYSRPSEIADRIEELNLPGAFLTDHGTVAGLSTFREAMLWKDKKKGVKRDLFVGYGMEAYQARNSRLDQTVKIDGKTQKFKKGDDSFHLILLAKSREGYRNLLRISDESHRTGFYYDPRVDWELLEKYKEGLICTSACYGSLVCQELLLRDNAEPLNKLARIFEDDFFVEISTYDAESQRVMNARLVEIANDKGIRLIYANDAHYATPDQWDTHEALLCAQYHEYLLAPKKYSNVPDDPTLHHPQSLYIMDESEVRSALDHLPEWAIDEAIETTDFLMEACNFEFEKSGVYLPEFKFPDEYESSAEMLEALVVAGLEERYELTDEVLDRAEFELNAIVEAGLQDYFLIVWDYIQYALRHGVMVGPGRGSVGGSILAYALGITTIDPLKYGLQFERFWNPGRADGLPDIDVDFEQSARQFMIEYVKKKYGENRVLPIGNHIFMRPKSAIDRAGVVMYEQPPYGVMTNVKNIIETTTDAGQQKTWDEVMEEVEEELGPYTQEPRYEPLFNLAEALSGRISTYGVHASAVVISSVDLKDHLPARMASDDDKHKVLVTQAEMKQVEKAGFPKFDFLGLRNLDTMMLAALLSGDFGDADILGPRMLSLIEERRKGDVSRIDPELREVLIKIIDHFRNEVNYNHLPDAAWELVDDGHTLGLFQIEESRSPRRIGKHIKPRNVEDLAAIVALNRPGPLRGGVVDRYLARRNGEEEVTYPHPILEEILKETYGDFLYQEQVIAYFRAIGYSLSDADHIRKILGKKLGEEMRAELPRYLERATEFMPKHTAEAIWRSIEDFSKYSFNKAHAVGYGLILAQTIYTKWRWRTFIIGSIMTAPKKVGQYINEARRIGIEVLPPDINRSKVTVSDDGDILYGLRDIKGIGEDAAAWIVKNAPYESPEDFYVKAAEGKIVKANHRAHLMNAGCFDSFGYRLAACTNCEGKGRVPTMVPKVKGDGLKRVLVDCSECDGLGLEEVDLPTLEEKVALEEELLGISLTDLHGDLIEKHRDRLDALETLSEADTEEKKVVKVPGVITTVQKFKMKPDSWNANRDWARVTIQWEGEELSFAAFPDQYDAFGYMLKPQVLGEFTLETGKKGAKLKKGYRLLG